MMVDDGGGRRGGRAARAWALTIPWPPLAILWIGKN